MNTSNLEINIIQAVEAVATGRKNMMPFIFIVKGGCPVTYPKDAFEMGKILVDSKNNEGALGLAREAIRIASQRVGAEAVCFVCEAWTIDNPDEEEIRKVISGEIRPSQSRNRKEVVIASVETAHVEDDRMMMGTISRDKDGFIRITEWNIQRGIENRGRLSGFFPKAFKAA